jgi:branched-chain amino acid transport system substrate-binding protein
MFRRELLIAAALSVVSSGAFAQDTVKIGLILPMTGQQASTGKQIDAAVKLYQARNGTTVAGKKVEVILKDDTGVPDVAKRLAQELVVNDKVAVLAGFGLTPIALAVAPIATQAKVPEVVMAAGTSSITEASPFVVRTSFTLAQSAVPMAEWAVKNGIKKVVTLVTDFGPGIDAEKSFSESSRPTAARSSTACACRCAAPISRRCCRRRPTPSPTRCSSSCRRGRARSS